MPSWNVASVFAGLKMTALIQQAKQHNLHCIILTPTRRKKTMFFCVTLNRNSFLIGVRTDSSWNTELVFFKHSFCRLNLGMELEKVDYIRYIWNLNRFSLFVSMRHRNIYSFTFDFMDYATCVCLNWHEKKTIIEECSLYCASYKQWPEQRECFQLKWSM